MPDSDKESMIVYKGSDVIFDHEEPKWNFWTSSAQTNQSFAKTCESIKEMGNATGTVSISLTSRIILLGILLRCDAITSPEWY